MTTLMRLLLCADLTRAGSDASTYNYSSSSFGRAGGADGTSYNRTFTERVGPGGVRACDPHLDMTPSLCLAPLAEVARVQQPPREATAARGVSHLDLLVVWHCSLAL